ncbi:MAG TPA: hypothetical protein VMQ65_08110 [Candidatus Limnocylindria bacterium]|nr:hypothetical protein [Candidatus Limnocylindria bacterium]
MPDDDAFDSPGIADVLLVETLMGWDGDRCECVDCRCERFRDGSDDTLCAACREGDHWRAHG